MTVERPSGTRIEGLLPMRRAEEAVVVGIYLLVRRFADRPRVAPAGDAAADRTVRLHPLRHPMIFETMARAIVVHPMRKARRITTAFAVRGFGYYERRYFADVDDAFRCSEFVSGVYREKGGLFSTPIEPPIDWSSVVAPTESAPS